MAPPAPCTWPALVRLLCPFRNSLPMSHLYERCCAHARGCRICCPLSSSRFAAGWGAAVGNCSCILVPCDSPRYFGLLKRWFSRDCHNLCVGGWKYYGGLGDGDAKYDKVRYRQRELATARQLLSVLHAGGCHRILMRACEILFVSDRHVYQSQTCMTLLRSCSALSPHLVQTYQLQSCLLQTIEIHVCCAWTAGSADPAQCRISGGINPIALLRGEQTTCGSLYLRAFGQTSRTPTSS